MRSEVQILSPRPTPQPVRSAGPRAQDVQPPGPAATLPGMPSACPECGFEVTPGAKFCPECGLKLVDAAPARETRKVVTILFADVTGSTSLGEQLDPESLRALMNRY